MCSCSTSEESRDHAQRVGELLGSVDLKEVADQGREAIAEAGRALGRLNLSERARTLGFGEETATIQREAAERSNRRARQQIQTVIDRIDHRVVQGDWRDQVGRVRLAFQERGGQQMLADLRADVRLRLLDAGPELSAAHAELALSVLDGALEAAAEGDLDRVVGYMRTAMVFAVDGFAAEQMGRQQGDPGKLLGGRRVRAAPDGAMADVRGWCVALVACLAWAYSSLVAGLIICFAAPFCWCCFHLAVLGGFAVHQLACFAAFSGPCNAQGGL